MKYNQFLKEKNEHLKNSHLISIISEYLDLLPFELKLTKKTNLFKNNKNLNKYYFSYFHNTIIYDEENNKLYFSNFTNNLTKNDINNLIYSLETFFNDFNIDSFELVKNNVEILNFIDDYTINGYLFDKDLIISYDLHFRDNKNNMNFVDNKIKIRIFNSELTINYYLFNKNKNKYYAISKTKTSKDFYKCIEHVIYEVYLKELYPEGKKSSKKLQLIKMDRY